MELLVCSRHQRIHGSALLHLFLSSIILRTLISGSVATSTQLPLEHHNESHPAAVSNSLTDCKSDAEAEYLMTKKEPQIEISTQESHQVQQNSVEFLAVVSTQRMYLSTDTRVGRKRSHSRSDRRRPRMLSSVPGKLPPNPPRDSPSSDDGGGGGGGGPPQTSSIP